MTERAPRLRVERLVIVESRSPVTFIRDVRLHAGLNIVWAEELAAADGGSEIQRAGHGVGKSTFSLMLRAVLGDEGVAVKTMRNHLAEYYGSGGIAAEVVAGTERFAVLRSFGTQSFALRNANVEQLFEEDARAQAIDFSTYLATLGEQVCLRYMATRALPVTGQAVEWGHVLRWLARDQALGLRQYFEWRNDDGTGLRRKVKDPPALTRLVLGLLSDAEAKAEAMIASINSELIGARDAMRGEEQRGTNTRAIVETQLRLWAKVSSSLDMVTDDLFAPSVEKVVSERTEQLEGELEEARTALDALDRELIELAADIKDQRHTADIAKTWLDEALALKNKNDQALKDARECRNKLLQLVGSCQYGGVSYRDCSHIQQQLGTISLSAQKEIGFLNKSVEELEQRERTANADYERESTALESLTTAQQQKTDRKKALNKAVEERLRHLGQGDSVRKTLSEWQENQKAPETEKLRLARTNVVELEKKLEIAKGAKVSAQQQVSDRERMVNARFAKLTEVFGALGHYVPADEKRPFHMLRADGDAYTVLEILLGDVACAADGVDGGGAHPGFLIFDCPREREMSPQLYDRFLRLLDEVCKAAGPGLQVVLTTTTPPPEPLREPPTRILKLSHASDDDLLLKRRIENLLTRVTPAMREEEDA
ncbi:hypothetical protein [Archangium violaceum]|uniref:hypothetical protein n=1 Tax=Archangium violaceum TaxID=83451 RepID=UPI0036DD8BF7